MALESAVRIILMETTTTEGQIMGAKNKSRTQQSEERIAKDKTTHQRIDNGEPFICACNGQKCEGICRETHLYRQRGIWASTPELQGRCPEASLPKQRKPAITRQSRNNNDR